MYTANSEYCNFGFDMMTDSWLYYMYRLTGLMKYASRKNYDAHYRDLAESSGAYSAHNGLIAA